MKYDRFGALPDEVRYLFRVVAIKTLCRRANVEKVDAGPKGMVISFRDNKFARPEKLIAFIGKRQNVISVRPDQKLVYRQAWDSARSRVSGVHKLMAEISALAA